MTGLVFVGMVGPDSHNQEEIRFVEELSRAFDHAYYLRGVGVKGLRFHQLQSIPARLASRRLGAASSRLRHGSLAIIPFRRVGSRFNTAWLTRQFTRIMTGNPAAWTIWVRFPSPELVAALVDLPDVRLVYEPIDFYSAAEDLSTGEAHRLADAERRLVGRATVVTGGLQLAERFRHVQGGSTWLPFGLDREQPHQGPGIPSSIPRPRLGLVGCLDWRVDESLLLAVMTAHPDWQLVLGGPRVHQWGRRLDRLSNVHWLGQVPVDHVRSVIRDCDVTLVPYRQTEWTRHCLPVKVFEYLAEGKPVIATPLPELEFLGDAITVGTPEAFAACIERSLTEGDPAASDRRRQVAVRFTLQDRARRAVQLLQGRAVQAATQ